MFQKNIILTEEQEIAAKACIDFILHGNPNEWFTLSAPAGAGKTTIIRKILARFRTRSIIVSALSHKAKQVITESVKQDNIPCRTATIAGMLGLTLNFETGKFERDFKNTKKPIITLADIIVIDESSMVNEEALKLIFQFKKVSAKVIFLGDEAQLGPIRDKTENFDLIDKISPVFDTKNKGVLTKRMRQTENHPILSFSDYYRFNTQEELPIYDPVPPEMRVDKEVGEGKIVFKETIEELYPLLESKFREAIKTNSPNKIKVVCYRNITRKNINQYFHEILFRDDKTELKQFNKNELIIFNDNYNCGDILIDNSSEYQIKKVLTSILKINEKEIKIFGLEIDVYDQSEDYIAVIVQVLADESKEDYASHVSELFKKAKALPERTKERNLALTKAWDAKNRFANIDYAFCITSHKSQGSTYDSVCVIESDIMATPISIKTKSRSIYTALTRARYEVFIV